MLLTLLVLALVIASVWAGGEFAYYGGVGAIFLIAQAVFHFALPFFIKPKSQRNGLSIFVEHMVPRSAMMLAIYVASIFFVTLVINILLFLHFNDQ
tara:strand:+ start:555 stop:842 length:288 start_codon:yes stop_codon:yes gene_type:complete